MTKLREQATIADLHHRPPFAASGASIDPLDPDAPGDVVFPVSRRSLVRLALVATEVGARFQREGMGQDPMEWMLAPRRLFEGRDAVSACLGLDCCLRAVMLHGLGFGFDASPDDMDDLIHDNDDDLAEVGVDEGGFVETDVGEAGPKRASGVSAAVAVGGLRLVGPAARTAGPHRLFTAVAVDEDEDGIVHAFDALVATDAGDLRDRLRSRHGARIAESADIREGFDRTAHMVQALVSDAMTDMLVQVAHDPTSPLARGLEVAVSQRFAE